MRAQCYHFFSGIHGHVIDPKRKSWKWLWTISWGGIIFLSTTGRSENRLQCLPSSFWTLEVRINAIVWPLRSKVYNLIGEEELHLVADKLLNRFPCEHRDTCVCCFLLLNVLCSASQRILYEWLIHSRPALDTPHQRVFKGWIRPQKGRGWISTPAPSGAFPLVHEYPSYESKENSEIVSTLIMKYAHYYIDFIH